MALHQSGEDYLETILILQQEKGYVRSIDVAQHLGFTKPSISRAMSILKASGYIVMEKDGRLELTAEGEAVAQRIYERHRFLTQWLVQLGVSPGVAEEDACKIEHNISDETFQCLKRHAGRAFEQEAP
ncbi:MAG: metal-dependent transcriptional regulator [Lawsonibacter sp.]|nr:metal-dependent transcriptional regulator [Lawsonibacter sp.]